MPVVYVEKALAALDQDRITQHSYTAMPIARLGLWVAAGAGAKQMPDEHSFNPFGAILYAEEARKLIDPEVANTFLDLSAEHKVPSWASDLIEVKLLRAAAGAR